MSKDAANCTGGLCPDGGQGGRGQHMQWYVEAQSKQLRVGGAMHAAARGSSRACHCMWEGQCMHLHAMLLSVGGAAHAAVQGWWW